MSCQITPDDVRRYRGEALKSSADSKAGGCR